MAQLNHKGKKCRLLDTLFYSPSFRVLYIFKEVPKAMGNCKNTKSMSLKPSTKLAATFL